MASTCQPERPSCSLHCSFIAFEKELDELQEGVTKDVKAMAEQILNRQRVQIVGQIPYVLERKIVDKVLRKDTATDFAIYYPHELDKVIQGDEATKTYY